MPLSTRSVNKAREESEETLCLRLCPEIVCSEGRQEAPRHKKFPGVSKPHALRQAGAASSQLLSLPPIIIIRTGSSYSRRRPGPSRPVMLQLKHRCLGPTPRVSHSVGLGWCLRMCLSDKFWGDADAVGDADAFGEPLHWTSPCYSVWSLDLLGGNADS